MTFDDLVKSMFTNGWKGDPIDVVVMRDGALASIDNTRVLAARQAGKKVQARVHGFDDVIPIERAKTLRVDGMQPLTWGEAASLRIMKLDQNIATRNGGIPNWSQRIPNGSLYDPRVYGRPPNE